jgi:hypothetical protein
VELRGCSYIADYFKLFEINIHWCFHQGGSFSDKASSFFLCPPIFGLFFVYSFPSLHIFRHLVPHVVLGFPSSCLFIIIISDVPKGILL